MTGMPTRGVRSIILAVACLAGCSPVSARPVTFLFTSDVHYGFFRTSVFRGLVNADARTVNDAAIDAMNLVPAARFPEDGGVRQGERIGAVDFVVITGDITNRQELYPIRLQSSAKSWAQFQAGYLSRLTLRNPEGAPSPLFLVPGNHDVSDAIGAPSIMVPRTDATSMAEIFNRMMRPAVPLTPQTYRYADDRVNTSRDLGGVHCVFLTVWPDSQERAWMERDLRAVARTTPVFIFVHDPPEPDPRHFINPNGDHGINRDDNFENLLSDVYADGATGDCGTLIEQRQFARFLKSHRNIVAYFHGHNNWNEYYTWTGPDHDLSLRVFRVDSPVKGKSSGRDERKLSFQVVVYDAESGKLTARQCFWNRPAGRLNWGAETTVDIAPGR